MITTTLTQLIERDWEAVAARLIATVRRHPDLQYLSNQSDLDHREWCRDLVENLGNLMSAAKCEVVQRRLEALGRIKCEEHVPLYEAVLRLQILKNEIVSFIHERELPMNTIQLYAEEEFEQRIARFFDECIYRLVRGYEQAIRLEQRTTRAMRAGG